MQEMIRSGYAEKVTESDLQREDGKTVKVGNDQENAQSERNSHS